ncbi:hypothetical protein ACHWQZ_G005700 [Mnemiopsis leidyi]
MADSTEKIKVLVLGDSGVGKTSLVNLISNTNTKPSWTVGCNVEVIYHESRDYSEFIEMWDVGGSLVHENSRAVFLRDSTYHGLVLVHDLTNSKSYTNMIKWALEFAQKGEKSRRLSREAEISLLRGIEIPKLIVGTKQDYLWSRSRYTTDRTGLIGDLNAQLISVNCLDHLQYKNSYQQQQIANFFDQVIKHKKTASNRFNRPFRSSAESPSSSRYFSSLDLGFSF